MITRQMMKLGLRMVTWYIKTGRQPERGHINVSIQFRPYIRRSLELSRLPSIPSSIMASMMNCAAFW